MNANEQHLLNLIRDSVEELKQLREEDISPPPERFDEILELIHRLEEGDMPTSDYGDDGYNDEEYREDS